MKKDSSDLTKAVFTRITPAQIFLILCLGTALYAAFRVVQPYAGALIMAGLIASLIQPVYLWILKRVKNKNNVASFLTCTLLVFVVLIPLSLIVATLINQGIMVSHSAQEWIKSGQVNKILHDPRWETVWNYVEKYSFGLDLDNLNLSEKLLATSSTIAKYILDQSGSIAANLSSKLLNFSMMIFVLFFFIKDGHTILNRVLHMTPLSTSQENRIIERIKEVAKSVFLGTVMTALVQGTLAGIAFAICGIPALFWGSILAFASLVPVVGTALVWIPAALYLLLTGKTGLAVFLTIYSIVLVGGVDNFLRPVFMKGAGGMSTFMIFLSVIGGVQLFGLSGLLYGPLVFGLAWILLIIYEIEFEDYLNYQDST